MATEKVVDENGVGLAYASLMIKNSRTGTLCNAVGMFEVSNAAFFEKSTVVSVVGYTSKTMKLKKDNDITIVLERSSELLSGEVEVIGFVAPGAMRKKGPIENVLLLSPLSKQETAFTLFPNPMLSGATVVIRWNDLIKGDYIMQLQSAAGKKVWADKINSASKSTAHPLQLPQLPAGMYVLTIIHIPTGKSYSEKIGIQ